MSELFTLVILSDSLSDMADKAESRLSTAHNRILEKRDSIEVNR